jgi:type IV pilus assembly protein PilW
MAIAHPRARRMSGLGLIELMISLAISSVLIAGAVLVYSQSRTTFTTNEAAARLQDEARYVLSVMEPDLQLAGYFGYSNAPQNFSFFNGGTVTPVSQLQQIASDKPLDALPSGATVCGANFAVDLLSTVEGSNDSMGLPSACRASGVTWRDKTDTLTIRRAGVTDVAPTKTRIQLLVNRMKRTNQRIFIGDTAPETLDPKVNAVRDLIVRSYYVANDDASGLPVLRVVSLRDGASAPVFEDTAIMPGIEDMQVQFGLDTGDYDGNGTIDPDQDQNADGIPDAPNGIATRYINPSAGSLAAFAGLQVVSVRIWLLVRAERPEPGFVNLEKYEYAGVTYEPKDNIRRALVSRTIQLRNARTL